ncbi:hypothetical protein [Mesorhizobium sp. M1E.F.Ca.ET.063.01.1.1]|uniref:hypothetical protein n=1 Tax=Mesorhizobium sp. M1E.F.Ca.ET.063.01.1.1 TaxID=2496750 RepID=UPI000FCCBD26|nr:hypothetical protein [Mesorhizobium sp. M1E.F.Ca.ET.063.01.1.1]RUW74977.1 hypothetical protein EOA29_29920 [Mesorhizobium sp. M1E.F.Ca.ET.063.01.1.1]
MKGLTVYLIGIAALGVVIGLFVGLSQSPVVSGVLTSLFGLLGVAGSFYLPWAQTTTNASDTRKTNAEAARESALAAADDAKIAQEAAARKTASATAFLAEADKKKVAAEAELAALQAIVPQPPADQLAAKQDEATQAAAQRTQAQTDLDAAVAAEKLTAETLADANTRFASKAREAKSAAEQVTKEGNARVGMTYTAAGASLTAFSLGLVVAALYGMLIRTGSNLSDLLPKAVTAQPVEGIDGQAAVDAVLLDRILVGLKVGPDERAKISHLAVTSCSGLDDLSAPAAKVLVLLNPLAEDESLPVAEATKHLAAFQTEVEKPLVANAPEEQRNFGRAQAALRETLADLSRLWLSPTFVTGHAEVARALGDFQVEAARYVGCEDVDQVLTELIAKLKDIKDTPVAVTVTAVSSKLETVPQ